MILQKRLLALGLALGALVPAATAQPAPSDWELRVGKASKSGHVTVRAGSTGIGVDLAHRRGKGLRKPSAHVSVHPYGRPATYVPGHYETRYQRVWVPCSTERVWVPAQVKVSYLPCGRRIETVLAPARWEVITHPGHYEMRQVRVWVPGRYRYGSGITTYSSARRYCR